GRPINEAAGQSDENDEAQDSDTFVIPESDLQGGNSICSNSLHTAGGETQCHRDSTIALHQQTWHELVSGSFRLEHASAKQLQGLQITVLLPKHWACRPREKLAEVLKRETKTCR